MNVPGSRLPKLIKRWLTGCLLFCCLACGSKKEQPQPAPADSSRAREAMARQFMQAVRGYIRSGDLVTRTGNDFTSFCLRQFCQSDKTYSHCGIASLENDTVFVYHALGGEFNPGQRILREPIQVFTAPLANYGFGVYRFALTEEQATQVLAATRRAYREGIRFDMLFDLATDEEMYCSEFTAKMFRRGFANDTMFTESRIGTFRFFAPDNLFLHPLCRPLVRAAF